MSVDRPKAVPANTEIYWITVGKYLQENYKIGIDEGLWAVKPEYKDRLLKVHKGDYVLFCSSTAGYSLCEVLSERFEDQTPVWPDDIYPYRIQISRPILTAPFQNLHTVLRDKQGRPYRTPKAFAFGIRGANGVFRELADVEVEGIWEALRWDPIPSSPSSYKVLRESTMSNEEPSPSPEPSKPPELVSAHPENLAVALCTKPFVILTGQSGTGKTKAAIEIACSFDYGSNLPDRLKRSRTRPATCLAFVPVEADWTDQRGLLGYRNPFGPLRHTETGETTLTYEVTEAMKLMLRAMHPDYRREPHFLVLDEMNLAHVERYFSSFLALMEADRSVQATVRFELIPPGNLQLVADVLREEGTCPMEVEAAEKLLAQRRGLPFPPNLVIIGTVNVDETTYMFSPKVLDRAFVIELGTMNPQAYIQGTASGEETIAHADLSKLLVKNIERRAHRSWEHKKPAELVRDSARGAGIPEAEITDLIETVQLTLSGTFKLLDPVGFGFGFRIINEVFQYLAVWLQAQALSTEEDTLRQENWYKALDSAITMKVLPKIHGSRRQLGDSMKALGAFFKGRGAPDTSYRLGNAPDITIAAGEQLPFSLPISSKKANTLHNALLATGYATFIR